MSLAKHVSIFFKADTKAFQSGLDRMSKRLNKFSRQTKKLGRSITTNFSIPFAVAGGAAVKMVADFDTSMTKLNTLVGVSEGQIEKFKESVLELSGEVAQSPNDLAEGLFFLTSAGLKGANAMETLEAVSKGVAIGLGEQTDLAKVAGAAQNAYGEDVLSAAESLDVFGKMVKTGMFESSELANVLGKEAGFAASLGVSFQELGAFISTYTRTTGDATSATVGVSGVLMAFTKETDKGEKALSKINMTYGSLREMLSEQGLQKTLLHLKEKFASNGVELSEFFSKSQSLKGVLNVLGNQTGDYINILDELENSSGMVNDGFETVSETTGFRMKKAFNDLKLAMMDFGVVLIPIAETFSELISKLSNKFKDLDKDTQKVFGFLGVALAASGPILMGVSLLTSGIGSAIKAVGLLRNAFVLLMANPALMAVAIAMGIAMTQINKTTESLDEQGRTIKKLTAGAKGWMYVFGFIKEIVEKLGERIGQLFGLVGNLIKAVTNLSTGKFGKAAEELEKGLKNAMDFTSGFSLRKLYKDAVKVIDDVTKEIEDKEYKMNQPTVDPKSTEELAEDFQKELDKYKPTFKVNGELDGPDGTGGPSGPEPFDLDSWFDSPTQNKLQEAISAMSSEMPHLDISNVRSSLEEYVRVYEGTQDRLVFATVEASEEIKGVTNKMTEMQIQLAEQISSGIGDAFADAIVDGKSFGESMKEMFNQLLREIIKITIQTTILDGLLKSLGLGGATSGGGGGLLGDLFSGIFGGSQQVNDIAFGPSAGRFITGPEGSFSLNPNDSIVAGTNLFGGQQNTNMTVNGYIDGSSIFLSNTRQTNTVNRLS
tara:strand:+ start:2225 stop:4708 length:2484 start_codon:yes stop_codon:yes gene_type:complete